MISQQLRSASPDIYRDTESTRRERFTKLLFWYTLTDSTQTVLVWLSRRKEPSAALGSNQKGRYV